jgi:CheY-like chemotaxis protein
MPEMDGFEFSEAIKKDLRYQNIPIVVLTAQDLTDDEIKRLSGNVDRIFENNETGFQGLLEDIKSRLILKAGFNQ